jgi:N-acetylneuraminic acid mutarotase
MFEEEIMKKNDN